MANHQANLMKATEEGQTIVVSSGDFEGVPVTYSPQRKGDRAPWVTASGERFAPRAVAVQGATEEAPSVPVEAPEASTEGSQATPERKPRKPRQRKPQATQEALPEAPTEEATEGEQVILHSPLMLARLRRDDTPEEVTSAPVEPQDVPQDVTEQATEEGSQEEPQATPEASTGEGETLPLLARLLTEQGYDCCLVREVIADVPVIRYVINGNGKPLTPSEAVEAYLTAA